MKTWLECVNEAAVSEGWITGQDFINAQSENTLDVFSQAAKRYIEQSNSHKHSVSGPASTVCDGGELLATEALDTLAEAGEETRKDFCIWYYAQSQPLDANKVFAWFLARK